MICITIYFKIQWRMFAFEYKMVCYNSAKSIGVSIISTKYVETCLRCDGSLNSLR